MIEIINHNKNERPREFAHEPIMIATTIQIINAKIAITKPHIYRIEISDNRFSSSSF